MKEKNGEERELYERKKREKRRNERQDWSKKTKRYMPSMMISIQSNRGKKSARFGK
ncbi:MAG: hypothetical protein ACLTJ5_14380 [Clostridium sp.]